MERQKKNIIRLEKKMHVKKERKRNRGRNA